jgi:integrase
VNVWRKQTTRYRLNGKNVPKTTAGAARHVIESKRFYATVKTIQGKTKQIPLAEDRKASLALLRRLQTEADRQRAVGVDRYTIHRERPLLELLDAYAAHLRAKENTPDHVKTTTQRCRSLIEATKAKTVGDLDATKIASVLESWRKRTKRPLSLASSNHYLVALKSFSRWLWTERYSPDDPLVRLRRLNAETDRRRVRRPLTPDELRKLIETTEASSKRYLGSDWQFLPVDRATLYAIAAFTGLRAKEIASLRRSSFDLESRTLTIEASNTKNRKRATLPLSSSLVERLRNYFASDSRRPLRGRGSASDLIFPGSWIRRRLAGKLLKRDLMRAGIAYRDKAGRYADFHSLRYTFVTALAKAGVHPAKAQRLARHSTIALTMNLYTSLDVDDLRDAVDSIG